VGTSPYQGAELLRNHFDAELPEVAAEAVAFLQQALADGPRLATDVEADASQAGLSWEKRQACKESRRRQGPQAARRRERPLGLGARRRRLRTGRAAGGVTPIPREAREGLLRAWLKVLSDRHPETTWLAVNTRDGT
jgi:hypothetical protein